MSGPVTVDAVGEDGKSILSALQGASPGGGLVRSESAPHPALLPGMLLRTNGGWAVVLTVHHYGVQGFSEVEYLGEVLPVVRRSYFSDQSVEVRTDVLIAADSLYKLVMAPGNQRCAYCRNAAGPFDKINTAGNLACKGTRLCKIRQALQDEPRDGLAVVCDDCYTLATGLLAVCEDGCARPLDHPGVCPNRLSDESLCDGCGSTDERFTLITAGDLAA
jgi:hypothetical protein